MHSVRCNWTNIQIFGKWMAKLLHRGPIQAFRGRMVRLLVRFHWANTKSFLNCKELRTSLRSSKALNSDFSRLSWIRSWIWKFRNTALVSGDQFAFESADYETKNVSNSSPARNAMRWTGRTFCQNVQQLRIPKVPILNFRNEFL